MTGNSFLALLLIFLLTGQIFGGAAMQKAAAQHPFAAFICIVVWSFAASFQSKGRTDDEL